MLRRLVYGCVVVKAFLGYTEKEKLGCTFCALEFKYMDFFVTLSQLNHSLLACFL